MSKLVWVEEADIGAVLAHLASPATPVKIRGVGEAEGQLVTGHGLKACSCVAWI